MKDYAAIAIEVRHVSYNAGMDVDDKANLEQGADAILELESELARLRKVIADAPHDIQECERMIYNSEIGEHEEHADVDCTCWKRDAMEGK